MTHAVQRHEDSKILAYLTQHASLLLILTDYANKSHCRWMDDMEQTKCKQCRSITRIDAQRRDTIRACHRRRAADDRSFTSLSVLSL